MTIKQRPAFGRVAAGLAAIVMTLAANGACLPDGCKCLSIGAQAAEAPAGDANDTASSEDTGVDAEYTDDYGMTGTMSGVKLITGSESVLAEGWYMVSGKVAVSHQITINGNAALILSDGSFLSVKNENADESAVVISDGTRLSVFGQKEGTGALSIEGAGNGVSGGEGSALDLYGGSTSVSGDNNGVSTESLNAMGGNIVIEGGSGVGADCTDVTLGCVRTADTIMISSFSDAAKVSVGKEQTLTDGTSDFAGKVADPSELEGKTLSAEPVCEVEGEKYMSLTEAIRKAEETGSTVKLLGCYADPTEIVAGEDGQPLSGSVSIDLGGYSAVVDEVRTAGDLSLYNGTLTADRFSFNGAGKSLELDKEAVLVVNDKNVPLDWSSGEISVKDNSVIRLAGGARFGKEGQSVKIDDTSWIILESKTAAEQADVERAREMIGDLLGDGLTLADDGTISAKNAQEGDDPIVFLGEYRKVGFKRFESDAEPYITVKVHTGTEVKLPNPPSRIGYDFAGWTADGENVFDGKTPVEEDMTLTARWNVKVNTITFDPDGGSEVAPITAAYGSEITYPEPPEKKGYMFLGWFIGETPAMIKTMPENDVTLTAKWVAVHNLFIFINGEFQEKIPGIPVGTPLDDFEFPAMPGFTFSGWDKVYHYMPDEDLYLYGELTINTHVLTYILNDEEALSIPEVPFGTPLAELFTPPEMPGFTFSGWEELPETMPDEDVTVTGSYIPNVHSLTFMVNGEVVTYLPAVPFGTPLEAPELPETEGFEFAGWEDMPETMPDEDLIITGTLTPITSLPEGFDMGAAMQTPYKPRRRYVPEPEKFEKLPLITPAAIIDDSRDYKTSSYSSSSSAEVGGNSVRSGDETPATGDNARIGIAAVLLSAAAVVMRFMTRRKNDD